MRIHLSGLAASIAIATVAALAIAAPAQSAATPFSAYDIDCATTTSCQAVGWDENTETSSVRYTNDGGKSWSAAHLPRGALFDDKGVYGYVSCAAATRCVAVPSTPSGTVLYTTDGRSWKSTRVPSGVSVRTVRCAAPTSCVAVGAQSGHLVTIVSKDGGRSWTKLTSQAAASPDGSVELDCATATVCQLLTPSKSGRPLALGTTDGARHWKAETLPSDLQTVQSVSCASALSCVAIGSRANGTLMTLVTTNGGTWQVKPSPLAGGFYPAVSCGTPKTCVAVLMVDLKSTLQTALVRTVDGGQTWKRGSAPRGRFAEDVSCTSAQICQAAGLRTKDGGLTWSAQAS